MYCSKQCLQTPSGPTDNSDEPWGGCGCAPVNATSQDVSNSWPVSSTVVGRVQRCRSLPAGHKGVILSYFSIKTDHHAGQQSVSFQVFPHLRFTTMGRRWDCDEKSRMSLFSGTKYTVCAKFDEKPSKDTWHHMQKRRGEKWKLQNLWQWPEPVCRHGNLCSKLSTPVTFKCQGKNTEGWKREKAKKGISLAGSCNCSQQW